MYLFNIDLFKALCLSSALYATQGWALDQDGDGPGDGRRSPRPQLSQQLTQQAREDLISCLTVGMDGYYKSRVIEALGRVAPERLTQAFVDSVNRLTVGMDEFDKPWAIGVLGTIAPEHLTLAFEACVNRLTDGMDGSDKTGVINALSKVAPDRLTPAFVDSVNHLTDEINGHKKFWVIEALCTVAPERLTPAFVDSVSRFTDRMDGSDKTGLIEALSKVEPDRLTPAFVDSVNHLTDGMKRFYKSRVIEALGTLAPECLTPAFESCARRLTDGMNGSDKTRLIEVLGTVAPECLTPAFESCARCLTDGMDGDDKIRFIRDLCTVASDQLAEINHAFTDAQLADIRRFVTRNDRTSLIRRLCELTTLEARTTEINRVIAQYRHDAAPRQPAGRAFGVHIYANTTVPDPTSDRPSQHTAMRLNDAVMIHIQGRMTGVPVHDMDTTLAALHSWITQHYEGNKERAFNAIQKAIDPDDAAVLPLVYSFIQKYTPDHIDVWMQGFLDESLNAYEPGQESCIAGMRERLVTSLRKTDPELDNIFKQVEGPQLAHKFISKHSKFNDATTSKGIIQEAGLKPDMRAEAAADAYEAFLRRGISEHVTDLSPYETDITTVKELMLHSFDTIVKPHMI